MCQDFITADKIQCPINASVLYTSLSSSVTSNVYFSSRFISHAITARFQYRTSGCTVLFSQRISHVAGSHPVSSAQPGGMLSSSSLTVRAQQQEQQPTAHKVILCSVEAPAGNAGGHLGKKKCVVVDPHLKLLQYNTSSHFSFADT